MLENRQNDGCITLAGISGEHSASVIGQKIFPGGANDSVRPRAGNSGGMKAAVMVAPETPARVMHPSRWSPEIPAGQMTASWVRRKSRRGSDRGQGGEIENKKFKI
ncbi:MAG: hypothetical protein LBV12_00110 [Puniceicoccales bacterium]|jgi:hypothetical protein|nr:hypothetical protein [Puniceicoccales bacterium]